MPFTIVRQDITSMNVDAIVNAANSQLLMGGGVCGAIFNKAGAKELQKACSKLAPINTGEAVITPGFNLAAKYIIHAVGPIYDATNAEQAAALLASAYLNSLKLAVENNCGSIAFPLISSGIYGYPKEEAFKIAMETITKFIEENEIDVYLTIFDKVSFYISKELLGEVASYIDDHYVETHNYPRRNLSFEASQMSFISSASQCIESCKASPTSLSSLVGNLDEPFADTLLRLIDEKGKTDVQVYKKANIDRRLFSKIRSIKGYTPKKSTILALAIGLELSLEETDDLLERAGYALSPASKSDVIVEYFIINKNYNMFELDAVLHAYDLPSLK